MTANDKLYVEVLDDEIIITLPGTSYAVTYYRATAFPQRLLTKSHSGGEDHDAPMTQAEFHGRAWRLANHKARELGWIVQPRYAEAPALGKPGLRCRSFALT